MGTPPKPDDKTLQVPVGTEGPSGKRSALKTDPRLKLGAEADTPSYTTRDLYAGQRTDVKPLAPGKAAAAEVSQGAWRERAFAPRGVMSAEEILKGLADALAEVRTKQGPKSLMLARLRDCWLQCLRQTVEQAGGDCLDAWLTAALKPGTGKPGINLVLVELYVAFEKMRSTQSTEVMLDLAEEAISAVKTTLEAPSRRPCSFKVLERELEGKIDVDGVLVFLLSSEDELTQRAREIGQTLERIRAEVKSMPGAKPDGMYSNFARLKAEARLIDGELKRRARSGT
ncbi:MAG: hypothetical protein IPJ65_12850 [Archangiaceae bacterium]|nr:hypothetical protein [Archangiaceae bacterium]